MANGMDHDNVVITGYKDVDIIMCGNPGVGKSTLLSSISKVQFKSGVSFGSGLTEKLEFKKSCYFEGTRFGDTPGLADIKMAKKAAEAITSALLDGKANKRNLKLFFVATETNGRVRPEDLFTIKEVTESIKLPNGRNLSQNEYGVIINQCELMDHPLFEEGRKQIEAGFYTRTATLPYTTTYITFLPKVPELTNQEDAKFRFKDSFFEWIFNLPAIGVDQADEIDVSDIDQKLAKARDQYKNDLDEIKKKLENEYEEMRRIQSEMMQKMEEKIEESRREKEKLELELEENRISIESLQKKEKKDKRKSVLKNGFKLLAEVVPLGKVISKVVDAIGQF